MNKKLFSIFTICIVLYAAIINPISIAAGELGEEGVNILRASEYIDSYYISVTPLGSGKLSIDSSGPYFTNRFI